MHPFANHLPIARTIALSAVLAFGSAAAVAQAEKPQYGGTLNIGTVYVTLSPLSWDPADWAWKHNQDTGLVYEQLFAGDLTKAKSRRRQASVHGRRLAAARRDPRRARRELEDPWTTRCGSRSSCARA